METNKNRIENLEKDVECLKNGHQWGIMEIKKDNAKQSYLTPPPLGYSIKDTYYLFQMCTNCGEMKGCVVSSKDEKEIQAIEILQGLLERDTK